MHMYELNALDHGIQNEWATGIYQFPQSYNNLFWRQSPDQWLNVAFNQKLMWITSVWTGRDNKIHIVQLRQQDTIIITTYHWWKTK